MNASGYKQHDSPSRMKTHQNTPFEQNVETPVYQTRRIPLIQQYETHEEFERHQFGNTRTPNCANLERFSSDFPDLKQIHQEEPYSEDMLHFGSISTNDRPRPSSQRSYEDQIRNSSVNTEEDSLIQMNLFLKPDEPELQQSLVNNSEKKDYDRYQQPNTPLVISDNQKTFCSNSKSTNTTSPPPIANKVLPKPQKRDRIQEYVYDEAEDTFVFNVHLDKNVDNQASSMLNSPPSRDCPKNASPSVRKEPGFLKTDPFVDQIQTLFVAFLRGDVMNSKDPIKKLINTAAVHLGQFTHCELIFKLNDGSYVSSTVRIGSEVTLIKKKFDYHKWVIINLNIKDKQSMKDIYLYCKSKKGTLFDDNVYYDSIPFFNWFSHLTSWMFSNQSSHSSKNHMFCSELIYLALRAGIDDLQVMEPKSITPDVLFDIVYKSKYAQYDLLEDNL